MYKLQVLTIAAKSPCLFIKLNIIKLTGSSGKLQGLYILNMARMRLKREIPTVYRLILLPPLSFTESVLSWNI